jgi:hypothetical protein
MIAWGNTTDRILLLLEQEPLTKAEICRKLGLTHDQVANRLSHLKRASKRYPKRIYIYRYTRHAISGRAYIRPVYALGNKPDTKKTLSPLTIKERAARSYSKLLSLRNNSIFNQTASRRELTKQRSNHE